MAGERDRWPALMSKKLGAEYLSTSERQLDELRRLNLIVAHGNGKHALFKRTELDRYIDSLPERMTAEERASA